MVLEFPVMADYGLLVFGEQTFYATHGHVFGKDFLPPMQKGDILIQGHTHLLMAEYMEAEGIGRIGILNPGSVSIPKGGNPATYGLLKDGVFQIRSFEGDVVRSLSLETIDGMEEEKKG